MSDDTRLLDRVVAVFDVGSLVGDAGLLAVGTLAGRLGLEGLIDETVRPPAAGRGSGAKVLTAVCSMLVGGSFFSDADRLRAGSAGSVVGFAPVAPSTLGTFLRSFTWGHVRQLDRVQELALGRAWAAGAAPAAERVTVDVDSTVAVVHSDAKGGAAYGHGGRLGYHPLVASRDDTGEIVHSRMRKGSSQRGHVRFFAETVNRVRRLAPDAELTVRADAGFLSWGLVDKLDALDARFVIAVASNPAVGRAVAAVDDADWTPIGYTDDGEAQVAETTLTSARRPNRKPERTVRLVVRRTRLVGDQADLFPNWRHHTFVTDISEAELDTKAADAACRSHARVELATADLKAGGLAHSPSASFTANAAWLACAALAYNIARWTARIGQVHDPRKLTVGATIARRLLTMPGRLVNRSGRPTLRLPARWPWADTFTTALRHIRNLPQRC
ncbi:IS1380 family transposase [Candidatus Poriferisodalis sp.]|uniref:IS1380 family transposase n=1 Tax=Candidatus Poriferisodalis sp. TaxID=3101277 RepID=UPI003B023A54